MELTRLKKALPVSGIRVNNENYQVYVKEKLVFINHLRP
jgi:hypothetical protein